jgi:hypothetical protein
MHGPSEIVAGTVAPQGDRIHIPTNGEGQIIAKKSVFHRACRQTASVCLDVTIRDFQKHLQSRRWALLLNELEKEFYFNPPLPKDYVENYLKGALKTARSEWWKHWKKYGTQHRTCLDHRYATFVAFWSSDEGKEWSEKMTKVRKQRPSSKSTTDCSTESSDGAEVLFSAVPQPT